MMNKEEANISIDGIKVNITDPTKNIVEIAKEVNVTIPAPCYHAKRKYGCCKACVIVLDGKQAYACATKPTDGMSIVVDREDLNDLRKERLLAYKKGKDSGEHDKCDCS